MDELESEHAPRMSVQKLDRLTRSVRDLGALLDDYFAERFALLSVADSIDTRTAGGRLVLNVLASVSQWEREAVSERTVVALAHLKQNGVVLGRRPLGLKKATTRDRDGRVVDVRDEHGRVVLVPDPTGLATVKRAQQLRASGKTLAEIAATLALEGRKTSRGGKWVPETVRLLLARAA